MNTKCRIRLTLFVLATAFVCRTQASQAVFSGSVESNGTTADSTINGFSWYAEQFANIRMNFDVGEKVRVYTALNAKAVSGKEEKLDTQSEIERLYFSFREEKYDISAGFMRMAFGYGQAFKPSDFLNPPNPLYPDARQKGALGAIASYYPTDTAKIQIFGADRTDPYERYEGFTRPLAGAAAERHTTRLSAQILYAIQRSEQRSSHLPVNYCGASLKFDAVAGFALDTLYTYDGKDAPSAEGLQFAFGADYSMLKGDLYFLGQYFYNGDGVLDSDEDLADLYGSDEWNSLPVDERIPLKGFADFYRKHYLYFLTSYSFSDYTRLNASALAAVEDLSFLPELEMEHEPFQGMTLSLGLRLPMDPQRFGGSQRGELGADHSAYSISFLGSARLKF